MQTQEERLSTLERSISALNAAISDINHNETMLLGMVTRQEEIIREVHARLATLNEDLAALKGDLATFEQGVNSRFDEHTGLLTRILELLSGKS
jgi:septal ring factor EnvC (AmiA/AmiB activator)